MSTIANLPPEAPLSSIATGKYFRLAAFLQRTAKDAQNSLIKHKWKILAFLFIMFHLIGAFIGKLHVKSNSSVTYKFFDTLSLSGGEFFSNLFAIGLFFYFVFLAAWNLGLRPPSYFKSIGGAFCLSVAISVLLAADAYKVINKEIVTLPKELSGMIYLLITQRQALLVLTILTLVVVGVGAYHIFRTLFSVTYEGTGIQIKLPGQTVYYVPIYPQISWQNTGITVKTGDKLNIELSGYVSPGAIGEISELKKHMEAFDKWQQKKFGTCCNSDEQNEVEERQQTYNETLDDVLSSPTTWPYTGPEGYKEEWYGPNNKLPILKTHRNYRKDYFFREDDCLTVKGLPHNRVIGIIRAKGEPTPKEAGPQSSAYDYLKDRDTLLDLSSDRYPFTYEANKSGDLWVVINDVDIARWDNSGMFFLKLTRNAWL